MILRWEGHHPRVGTRMELEALGCWVPAGSTQSAASTPSSEHPQQQAVRLCCALPFTSEKFKHSPSPKRL